MTLLERIQVAIFAFNDPEAAFFGGAFYNEVQHAVDTGRTVLFESQYAPQPGRIIMQYVHPEIAEYARRENRSGGMSWLKPS